MAVVNYYLKKKEKGGTSLIYLQMKYSGYKLVFSFGQSINPQHWNGAKQRVKNNQHTTACGQYALNDLLDTLEALCQQTYYSALKNGIPRPTVIKEKLLQFMRQNEQDEHTPTLYKLIDRFVAGEIHHKGRTKAKNTLNKYQTVRTHLRAFEAAEKYPIHFESITLEFFHRYVAFLKGKGLMQNTIAKDVQVLKTFMGEAVDLGYTTNTGFRSRKFSAAWQDVDAVYLREDEILQLYRHDFTLNPRLEAARDLFVFGCCVGLRFSDYSTVRPENITEVDGELFLKIVTQKTGELVVIPCHPIVQEIFQKYSSRANRLPKAPSIQKFNQYIKDACKEAGLTEAGRLLSEPEKELWQVVSSHTARRSFATNLFLEGYPTLEIMKISGHRSEKAFLKYIRVSKLDAAKRLSKHLKVKWSAKMAQVA